MNKFVKGSLLSAVTCAILLTMQGCGKDRAGISVAEVEKGRGLRPYSENNNTQNPTPDDFDGDGIKDEIEKQPYINACGEKVTSNWREWDTDGDGLSDGYEKINTYPNGKCTNPREKDTDGDGINDKDEIDVKEGDPHLTDPTNVDTDNDGLWDGDEINHPKSPKNMTGGIETDPTNKDTDGDGLSDGFEVLNPNGKVKRSIISNPTKFDSDDDGVSDGIEACGTDLVDNYGKGRIITTNVGIVTTDTNDFYDDNLSQLIELDSGIKCDKFADTQDNMNDSDGDGRPNIKEKEYKGIAPNGTQINGTDPLDAGIDANETIKTADVNESLNSGKYYPWITQTPDGEKMKRANFEYVPKKDSKGFWISKYEAVYTDDSQNKVKFVSDNNKVDNISLEDASSLIKDSKVSLGINNDINLPTLQQFGEILNSEIFDHIEGNCIVIKNNVNDFNMPKESISKVCEIIPENSFSTNQEFYQNGTIYIKQDRNYEKDNNSGANQNTHFRAATGYMPDMTK